MKFLKNRFRVILGTLIVILMILIVQFFQLTSSHTANMARLQGETLKATTASDKVNQKIQSQIPGDKLDSLTEANNHLMKLLFNYNSGKQYRDNQKKLGDLLPDQAKILLPEDDDSTGNSYIDGIGLRSKVTRIEILSAEVITNSTHQVEVYVTGEVHGNYKNYSAQSDSLGVKVLYKGTYNFDSNKYVNFERVGKLNLSAQSGS